MKIFTNAKMDFFFVNQYSYFQQKQTYTQPSTGKNLVSPTHFSASLVPTPSINNDLSLRSHLTSSSSIHISSRSLYAKQTSNLSKQQLFAPHSSSVLHIVLVTTFGDDFKLSGRQTLSAKLRRSRATVAIICLAPPAIT